MLILTYNISGSPFTVKLSFTNPLPVPLTGLKWVVEGSGLMKPQVIKDPRFGLYITVHAIDLVIAPNLKLIVKFM